MTIRPPPLERAAGAQPVDRAEEDRREEDAEDGHSQHAAEDGDAQGAAHLGPGAPPDQERNHAENEGEGGHDDRPQAEVAGLHGGLAPRCARLALPLGELDDQDCILAGQADQHDEADLREDVDVGLGGAGNRIVQMAADANRMPRARACTPKIALSRHMGTTRITASGMRPTFILRGKHEKHRQDGEPENGHRRVARLNLQVGHVRPFQSHTGQKFLVGKMFHQIDGLPRADSRPGGPIDGGGREHVVAVDDQRAVHLADVGQRAQRHHPAGVVADLQPPDLFDAVAERPSAWAITCQVRPKRLKSLT